ncbi:hypothetical protein NKH19_33035 [Mesorhizobium sp. M1338]|uniref:hypothetical protein n=1 Tax=Mesorhizobium sp. M1338 TaxID=2957085 RepID=UPI0033383FB6
MLRAEGRFVHSAALFAPDPEKLVTWLKKHERIEQEDGGTPADQDELDGDAIIEPAQDYVDENPVLQKEDLTDEQTEAYKVAAE